MGEAQYDFYILVTCLLILALQIHNPFQSRPVCQCTGEGAALPGGLGPGDGFAAPPIGAAAAAQRVAEPPPQPQQAAASRRPRAAAAAPSGAPALSESDLLRELQSIQAKAKDQQEVLAAAGRMPPPSPILQQLKESEAAQAGARGAPPAAPRGPRAPAADFGARAAPAQGFSSGAAVAADAEGAPFVRRRSDLGRFLEARQPGGLGVLLGVGRGEFALQLLTDWASSMGVYLVDPYIHIAHGYRSSENLPDKEMQMVFEDLRMRLQPFEGRYVLARDFSYSFAQTYKIGVTAPAPPTFVYVDANHAEEAVSRDLELWWPHLAAGGIMAGSTYADDADGHVRVKSAVDRFAARQGTSVFLTHDDMPPTWFMLKP